MDFIGTAIQDSYAEDNEDVDLSPHYGEQWEDILGPPVISSDDSEIVGPTIHAEHAVLMLPSTLGRDKCISCGLATLLDQEIKLRLGQANDALHELRLALVDKAILFRQEVRHAKSQSTKTRAWARVGGVQTVVVRHAAIYRRARRQLVSLGADAEILAKYRPLLDNDLKVTSAVADPNSRGERHSTLAWFWSIDIPGDTEVHNWMSECRFICVLFQPML